MKDLVKNPIGIIALFISLIYGFANLLLGVTAASLSHEERTPLILFIVLFPVVVLGVFYLLVSRHHGKLYAPGDYKDDTSFLRTLSQEEREQKFEKEVEEALPPSQLSLPQQPESVVADPATRQRAYADVREELRLIESLTVAKFEKELNQSAMRDVAIEDTDASFDAMFAVGEKYTFLEVKSLRSPYVASTSILDRILYNAVIAEKAVGSNIKLILAVVYTFEAKELSRFEKIWRRRIEKCPVAIELRFISRDELGV